MIPCAEEWNIPRTKNLRFFCAGNLRFLCICKILASVPDGAAFPNGALRNFAFLVHENNVFVAPPLNALTSSVY